MKKGILLNIALYGLLLFHLTGCASAFMKGVHWLARVSAQEGVD